MATIYKSSDSGAPVLNGTAGSMIDVLTAVLVDGYGTQAAAGWTKPFESAGGDVAVFQSSATNGLGFYYRIDEAAPADGRYAHIDGYESMTDVDTGTGHFNQVHASGVQKAHQDGNTDPLCWACVADDRGCWFVNYNRYGATETPTPGDDDQLCAQLFYVGDFMSAYIVDNYSACVAACRTSSIAHDNLLYVNSPPATYGNDAIQAARTYLGGENEGDTRMYLISTAGTRGYSGTGPYSWHLDASKLDAGYDLWQMPYLKDRNHSNIRGWLPGLRVPIAYPLGVQAHDIHNGGLVVQLRCGSQNWFGLLIDAQDFRVKPDWAH